MKQKLEATPAWNFHDEDFRSHITTLHPYPARFPPAIPREAIKALLPSPGLVLDPFAGCGTTLVEAQRQGHQATGIDVNHLAHLLQQCYTNRLETKDQEALAGLVSSCHETHLDSADSIRSDYANIPRLDHWFSPGAISAIGSYLRVVTDQGLRGAALTAAQVALSRVLVRISRQESDTQYRAVKPDIESASAWHVILDSIETTSVRLAAWNDEAANEMSPAICRLGDSRDPATYAELPEIDLVVTSPPYPNAYEYWLYHKYRMFWLDMDPLWSRNREIGARPFYSGSGKKGPADFLDDLRAVMTNVKNHASRDAKQMWVVGDCVIKGEEIRTAELVEQAASETGWLTTRRLSREVMRSRSSFQGIGRLKHEELLVLEAGP